MNVLDCRFSGRYPQQNREKKFPAALMESHKAYSGSCLLDKSPRIANAAWKVKQLAREQLRKPEVMGFIGRCLTKSPQEYGALLVEPDIKALSDLIEEANSAKPEGKDAIIRQAGIAVELMKIRNRLLFEGPQSAFAYYDSVPGAKKLHKALGAELHEIRIGLHNHGHFIFHPKTVALRDALEHRIVGRCLVLCESMQQAEALDSLFRGRYRADFSTDVGVVKLHNYLNLVLFSPTMRLKEAIRLFSGPEVIILAMKGTWEEGVYQYYAKLEESRRARQGSLGLDVPCDRP